MKFRSINALFFWIVTAVLFAAAGYFTWQYIQLRRENRELLRNAELISLRYAEQEEKLRENERILKRLQEDPAFVEMVIRRRLGYAKPGELIYNFEETPPEAIPLPPPPAPETNDATQPPRR